MNKQQFSLSLFLGAGLMTVQPCVGDSGGFTYTANLATARVYYTATLLPNGKVLVTGGFGTNLSIPLASAELYDSASATWAATGTLGIRRAYHTATLLLTGKVLVAGGYSSGTGESVSTELYDPASATWATTGSLGAARYNHTATLLPNGRVLVAGGSTRPDNVIYLASAELYDPAGGTWTGTGSLGTARELHTATLLPNGEVLVAGGYGDSGVLASTELYQSTAPTRLGNISTRLRVETGDSVLIAGFIVSGTQPKKIIVRAIGPSLPLAGTLADPILELHDSSGGLIASNDNWRSDREAAIIATGVPPSNDLESAIVATLPANGSAYTAILRGVNNGTGIGVVEAYDLDSAVDAKLANISTRGFVQTGDNVLIGGLIVVGQDPLRVIVRAIGPSLPLSGTLGDPTLELHDVNGALIASNDNWRSDQEAEIIATTIPPSNDLESAIVRTLTPGNYTAIVRGVNGTTGIALVEAYGLN